MSLPPIVVFDLDGTLAETAPDLMGTLNVILAAEGLPSLPLAKARELIGAGAKALLRRGFAEAGRELSADHLDTLFARFLDHYTAHIADGSHYFPGVLAAMDVLADRGFVFAVCTNKREMPARKLLKALGGDDRFRFIAGQDTFDVCKPNPRHLTETIRLAGGDPLRAVMVGDSRTDVDTARAAGIPVVGVTFGYTDVPMVELKPDVTIDDFRLLPDAVRGLLRATA